MANNKMIRAVLFALIIFPLSLFAKDFTVTNSENDRIDSYSIEKLESLPIEQMTTITPWRDTEDLYDGIYLNDLIKIAGYDVNNIRKIKITALNDYAVDIPKEFLLTKRYFVSFKRNGKRISVRQKGPITLILNFSDISQGHNILDISYDQVWFMTNIEIIK